MSDHAATEVWIDSPCKGFAYIRLGEKENLATVNRPEMAEVVRDALQRFVDASANGGHFSKE